MSRQKEIYQPDRLDKRKLLDAQNEMNLLHHEFDENGDMTLNAEIDPGPVDSFASNYTSNPTI